MLKEWKRGYTNKAERQCGLYKEGEEGHERVEARGIAVGPNVAQIAQIPQRLRRPSAQRW